MRADPAADLGRYAIGALLAAGAVACWTWYPIRNAEWLRAHPDRNPRGWATAQGVMTLPLALTGYALWWVWTARSCAVRDAVRPAAAVLHRPDVRDRPVRVVARHLCWNEASQRLPTTLAGQLIVFETLSALTYAFVLRGRAPEPIALLGIGLLVAGVAWALRAKPEPLAAQAHAA